MDGGVLDNIPIARAIDAIIEAPADGPTRRVLVYVQPGSAGEMVVPADGEPDRSTVAVDQSARTHPRPGGDDRRRSPPARGRTTGERGRCAGALSRRCAISRVRATADAPRDGRSTRRAECGDGRGDRLLASRYGSAARRLRRRATSTRLLDDPSARSAATRFPSSTTTERRGRPSVASPVERGLGAGIAQAQRLAGELARERQRTGSTARSPPTAMP